MLTNALQKTESAMPRRQMPDLQAIGDALQREGILTEEIHSLIRANRTDSLARQLAATATLLCEEINAAGGEKVHPQVLAIGSTPQKRRLRAVQECIQKIQL